MMPPMTLGNNPMMGGPSGPFMLPNLQNLNLNAPAPPQMNNAHNGPSGGGNQGNPQLNNSRNSVNANAASNNAPPSNPTLSNSRKSEVMHPQSGSTAAQ